MTSNKGLKTLQISVLVMLLFTQFNNCGFSAATSATGADSVSCLNASCIEPVPSNMNVMVNLDASGQFSVDSAITEFNLGGDCNEGGFPTNSIHWQLVLGGVVVRTSDMQVAGSGSADSQCVNGRFMLYINLVAISQDPVNRTGLLTQYGTRSNYNLNVFIYGQNTPTDAGPQAGQAQTTIPLGAI